MPEIPARASWSTLRRRSDSHDRLTDVPTLVNPPMGEAEFSTEVPTPFGSSSLMSTASTSSQSLLEELDLRQNEILDQLEELNVRIERVLKECVPAKEPRLSVVGE